MIYLRILFSFGQRLWIRLEFIFKKKKSVRKIIEIVFILKFNVWIIRIQLIVKIEEFFFEVWLLYYFCWNLWFLYTFSFDCVFDVKSFMIHYYLIIGCSQMLIIHHKEAAT